MSAIAFNLFFIKKSPQKQLDDEMENRRSAKLARDRLMVLGNAKLFIFTLPKTSKMKIFVILSSAKDLVSRQMTDIFKNPSVPFGARSFAELRMTEKLKASKRHCSF